MHGWYHQRSAPVGALLAGALALIATAFAAGLFYVRVVRAARGLPEYTAGLRLGQVARPRPQRAAYHVRLRGPADRVTPAGTHSVAHRWRVVAPAAPDDPLCAGAADDGVIAEDDSGARPSEVPLSLAVYAQSPPRGVPPRVLAVCAEAAMAPDSTALEYVEEVVRPGTRAEIVACARGTGESSAIVPCNDGAPSPVYLRAETEPARRTARGAVARVALCASAFALVCFGAALLAIRAFDRANKVGSR